MAEGSMTKTTIFAFVLLGIVIILQVVGQFKVAGRKKSSDTDGKNELAAAYWIGVITLFLMAYILLRLNYGRTDIHTTPSGYAEVRGGSIAPGAR